MRWTSCVKHLWGLVAMINFCFTLPDFALVSYFSIRWWRYLQEQVNNPQHRRQLNNIQLGTSYLQAQLQRLSLLKKREKQAGRYSLMVKSYCPLPSKKISGIVHFVTTGQTGSDNTWKLTRPRFQIGQQQTTSAMKYLPRKEGDWRRKGQLILR